MLKHSGHRLGSPVTCNCSISTFRLWAAITHGRSAGTSFWKKNKKPRLLQYNQRNMKPDVLMDFLLQIQCMMDMWWQQSAQPHEKLYNSIPKSRPQRLWKKKHQLTGVMTAGITVLRSQSVTWSTVLFVIIQVEMLWWWWEQITLVDNLIYGTMKVYDCRWLDR